MNTEWINLNASSLPRLGNVVNFGTSTISPSPYNIPTGVRYSYEPTHKKGMLEFRYLDASEPSVSKGGDSGFAVSVGKKSHRIFKVSFMGDRLGTVNPDGFVHAIDLALTDLSPVETTRLRDNVEAAKAVWATFGGELLKNSPQAELRH